MNIDATDSLMVRSNIKSATPIQFPLTSYHPQDIWEI